MNSKAYFITGRAVSPHCFYANTVLLHILTMRRACSETTAPDPRKEAGFILTLNYSYVIINKYGKKIEKSVISYYISKFNSVIHTIATLEAIFVATSCGSRSYPPSRICLQCATLQLLIKREIRFFLYCDNRICGSKC